VLCTAENEEGVRAFLADEGWQVLQVEEETQAMCLTVGRVAGRQMQNCMVCGGRLDYLTAPVEMTCAYCGRVERGYIRCPGDHYVCEACHNKGLSAFIYDFARATELSDPLAIAQAMMAHPSLPMLSCAHAPIVAAALLAALRNSGRAEVTDDMIAEGVARTERQAISGYCGLTGVCGVPVAVGAAFSVVLGARCGLNEPTTLTMRAVGRAVDAVAEAMGPSCCRKFVGVALESAVGSAAEFLERELPLERRAFICVDGTRHPLGCHGQRCAYFGQP